MGWKQFDVIAEIASLNIPLTALRSIEKKTYAWNDEDFPSK